MGEFDDILNSALFVKLVNVEKSLDDIKKLLFELLVEIKKLNK